MRSRTDLSPLPPSASSPLVCSNDMEHAMNFRHAPALIGESLGLLAALPYLSIPLDLGYEPPVPDIRWRNSKITLRYLASKFQSFPATFVNQGKTPFIHHRLYSQRAPSQIQEAYRVCKTLARHNGQNTENHFSMLKPKLEELKAGHDRIASFDDMLASVQALMLYLVLCLFNENSDLRRTGEQYCQSLDLWTRSLCEQAPAELSHSLSPWRAWYYAESVRRSILISHMIRAVYATMKQGYYVHTLFVEALPFDSQTMLWDAQSASEWIACAPSTRPQILSYREYADGYATGTLKPNGLFERLLLAACYGRERIQSKLLWQ